MKIINKTLASICLGTSLAVIVGCSATQTSESTGQYIDSATITTKVKAKLLDKLGTKSLSIKVKSYKEEVQLSGFVDSQKIKDQATKITQSVGDVKKVRNDLIVK